MTNAVNNIPCVDLGRYQRAEYTPHERQQILADVARACEDHGFFFLSGHGEQQLIDRVFSVAEDFFAQPRGVKQNVMRDADNPLGYFDRELTKQKRDCKEVFDFRASGYQSKNPAKQQRWPDQPQELRATLTEFFEAFTRLSKDTLTLVFVALGMRPEHAQRTLSAGFGDSHGSMARLNYYPAFDPVPQDERAGVNDLGDMALHHHTDPGGITLLLQDDHGGLQAHSKQLGWIDIPPRPGTIVVNVGDVLQVWTNDRCTAGIHRVLPIPIGTGRYSVPFFFQPRMDATIEPWLEDDESPHYRAFSWREFIGGRVSDNFADYGAEDIQISRYRVA